jgi:hypothetical protein
LLISNNDDLSGVIGIVRADLAIVVAIFQFLFIGVLYHLSIQRWEEGVAR